MTIRTPQMAQKRHLWARQLHRTLRRRPVEVLDMRKSKDVLNVEEAAQLLGVSAWTVREQARQGHLPGRKVGKEWRFSRQGLMIWLQDGVRNDLLEPPASSGQDAAANW